MTRLSLVLVAIVGLLAGALGSTLLRPAPVTLGSDDVRAVVAEALAADRAMGGAAIDPAKLNPLIETYLLDNPKIIDRVNAKLQMIKVAEARAAQKATIEAHYADIYQQPNTIVLGNPKGDVTLVEMFDYNCSYCRGALPDLVSLMAEDPNLKVILKEFPILTAGSVDAARVAVLVAQDPKINYWDFHQRLFAVRGEIGAAQALQVAEDLGGNRVEMMVDMNGRKASDPIQKSYDLAKALNISGTPTYILGDELIPGALPIDQLRAKIANLRACGSTICPAQPAPAG